MNEELAREIRIELARKKKNFSWLAQEMNTSTSNVSNIMKRLSTGKGVRIGTLSRIERVLGISFFSKFN